MPMSALLASQQWHPAYRRVPLAIKSRCIVRVTVVIGDVLKTPADVLISTANPWLNLSGGVNGAIREVAGPGLQLQLHQLLHDRAVKAVPVGTVVRSDSFGLPFKHILHVVAIDPFYDTSAELVKAAFAKAMGMAIELKAATISSPMLATGYGPLSVEEFASAIAPALKDLQLQPLSLNLVVRREEHASILRKVFSEAGIPVVE